MKQVTDQAEVTRLYRLYMADSTYLPLSAWHGKLVYGDTYYIIRGSKAGVITVWRATGHDEAMAEFRRLDAKIQRLIDIKNAIQ